MRRIAPIALAAAAPAVLILAFAVGSIPDEEEFRWGILTSFLHVRALGQGTLGTWTSMLGLGMPQPMAPNFDMHPLVPLLLFVSPITWTRLLLVTHTVVGAVGMWHLGGLLRISPWVRAICVFTFMLATPTQNYVLSDFWPSHYVMWTAAPWLLLAALKTIRATGPSLRWWSVLLGVSSGLVLANTHPAHAPVYAVVVVAVAATEWRAMLARWPWLVLAAGVALAIASPPLVQLAAERRVFGPDLTIVKLPEPLPAAAVSDVFLRPLSLSDQPWQTDVVARGTRVLFFGGPFAVLCLVGLVRGWRQRPALALGVVLGTVLVFTPLLPLTFVSRFHIRDPLLLCAIPLAGLAADDLLRHRRTRIAALILLVAQVMLVAVSVLPLLDRAWDRTGRLAVSYRGATGETPAVDRLLASMPDAGRLAFSPEIDLEVFLKERLEDGLAENALAYRGRPVVNGTFKGISTDALSPDDRLYYGRIRVPPQLIESDIGLDLLGIRYVLANPAEQVARGLRMRDTWPKTDGSSAVLYENADASPGAFVVREAGPPIALSPYPGCLHDRLLCKDFAPLASVLRQDRVDVSRGGSSIEIDLDPLDAPRIIVVAEMYRPGWTAARSDGGALETFSFGPGLLGVRLPPSVPFIRLSYEAPVVIGASLVAWLVLTVGLAALGCHNKI